VVTLRSRAGKGAQGKRPASGHHPNAGSAYGFVAAVLGPRAGLVAAGLCSEPISALPSSASQPSVCSEPICCNGSISGATRRAFALTALGILVVAPLSIIPTRRAGLVLIILEDIAVVAMLVMACAVLVLVTRGHGPQGDPALRDLFIPTEGVGAASIAKRPDAFTMSGDPLHQLHVGWIIDFMAKNRLHPPASTEALLGPRSYCTRGRQRPGSSGQFRTIQASLKYPSPRTRHNRGTKRRRRILRDGLYIRSAAPAP
jgi:hypothetical protein